MIYIKKAVYSIVLILLSVGAYSQSPTIKNSSDTTKLKQVTIVGKTPPVEHKQGKTIINVEVAASNAGTTVLEVLEKSPGITVDRNGGIAMQGKTGVLVMIDDKPTYLSGSDLNNLCESRVKTC
jgi:hypothetical protein